MSLTRLTNKRIGAETYVWILCRKVDMRFLLAVLMVSCPVHAQINTELYRKLVQDWLTDARPWLKSINRSNDELFSASSKLESRVPADVQRSAMWASLQQNQAKLQGGFRTISEILQRAIAEDERYQRQLNPSGGIDAASVADNLRSRAEFQQSVAQALEQFVLLLKQIDGGLQSLPPSMTDSVEFRETIRMRDVMSGLLENSAKQFAARSGEYEAMLRYYLAAQPKQR
jgi:hypothetical protein